MPSWMRLRLPAMLLALGAVYGLSLAICPNAFDAMYLAAVPGFLIYVTLCRPEMVKAVRARHAAYAMLLVGLTVGYLCATAGTAPTIRIRWSELGVALYFLAALHVIIYAMDRLIDAGLCKALSLAPQDRRPMRRFAPKTALRIAALMLVAPPFVASALLTHWLKFDDSATPQTMYAMQYVNAGFDAADGTHIAGWYMPADARDSDAAVILVGGRGMSKAALLPQAKLLQSRGFSVLLMDLRGEGDSQGHASGMGLLEGADVLGALEYLKQAHPRQSEQVFGVGVSQGACAVLAAAGRDERIRAVVADSTIPTPAADVRKVMSFLPGPVADYYTASTLLFASAQTGCNLFDAGPRHDIAAIAPRPVLLIHGLADTTVSIAQAQELYACAHDPAMLLRIGGAGHGEAPLTGGQDYSDVIRKTFNSVRLGQPAFGWAAHTNH